ncbi:ATP-dependent DNA helicase PIF1 [Senna tora]|uniref:ATP-dependent DNA helicase n=1 Tax=Senna tora TaxID=362788 RepID=A0A834SP75_9FABA|nr:ATP-dependent DNA helicase PIF1 [Senna tora]
MEESFVVSCVCAAYEYETIMKKKVGEKKDIINTSSQVDRTRTFVGISSNHSQHGSIVGQCSSMSRLQLQSNITGINLYEVREPRKSSTLKHRRSPSSDISNDKESMNIPELRASRARDARKHRKSILMQRRMRTAELTSIDLCTASDHTRNISSVVQNSDAVRRRPNQRVVNEASQPDKLNEEYVDIGLPTHECEHCGAIFWYEERVNKSRNFRKPKFSLCCLNGKVELPKMRNPPETLQKLLLNNDARSKHFKKRIRTYNNMFAFTSMGGKVDNSTNDGKGPYVYRLHGQNMHLIGGLLPDDGENPQFSQLYIYDTDNELLNRMRNARSAFNDDPCDATVVMQLSEMLDSLNPLVQVFRSVKNHPSTSNRDNLRLKLIKKRQKDTRVYNLPTADEIAALIVGDFDPKKEDGYREDAVFRFAIFSSTKKEKNLTLRQYFAYILQDRRNQFNIFLRAGKLTQQFIVDGYTMIESQRLLYIRLHEKELRADNYTTLTQALAKGQTRSSGIGKRIVLPSTFIGGERYCRENFQDAMTICTNCSFPELFITFTCNPKRLELCRLFESLNCTRQDRPDLLSRVFKIKLNSLMRDITKNFLFGSCRADIYSIEFQKRGLPHAHNLIWLNAEHKLTNETLIDSVICAKIPDPDTNPKLYEAVKTFMIHGPCGSVRKSSPCMINSRCSKHFPKKYTERTSFYEDGYCKYRRRDSGNFVEKNGIKLDNRFVVPYNPTLLLRYQAHINVEFCNQSRSIKYLFKYVSKGYDKVTAALCSSESNYSNEDNVDEIKMYYDCRYISACEAAWRIFGVDINFREPSVERLPFHLPDKQGVVFGDYDSIDPVLFNATVKQTKFLAWFEANKIYPKAKSLTYAQFPSQFVYKTYCRQWFERKSSCSIGRLYYVAPGSGELYYLRLLLTFTKGPTCYEDIRTINSFVYPTFKDACYVMGLLDDDKEYIEGIVEDSKWSSGFYLRKLFVTLLIHNTIARPSYVWENTWMHLSDDILLKECHRTGNPDLHLDNEHVKNIALADIENILKLNGRSLANFTPMTMPNKALMRNLENLLINEELNYDRNMLKLEHDILLSPLTSEQKNIYDTIMAAVNDAKPGLFFVNGFGGSGKTYIWNTLTSAIRSNGDIVLAVASSGIASQLIPGGRTAHSRFAIPLNIDGNSTCQIVQGSDLGNRVEENESIARFAEWILKIGDGIIRNIINDEEHEIDIDDDILIGNVDDPIRSIVDNTYSNFLDNFHMHDYFRDRAILSPTLDDVAKVNDFMLSLLPGEEHTYLSSDTMCNQQPTSEIAEVYTTEFLNTILGSGLPYQELKLKVGAPIMLLRNIDRSMGLYNGTRLILTRMYDHVIEASIMSGKFAGEKIGLHPLESIPVVKTRALHGFKD